MTLGLRLVYHTDPACPRSWGWEPALARLEAEFAGQLEVEHVLAPREFDGGEALRWLEQSALSGMPVDVRMWLDRPPRASHAACYAVRAATEQGLERAMLRRLREGFALERRALETIPALVEAGRDVRGLDLGRFEAALRSSATVEALSADLERGRGVPAPALAVAGGAPQGDPAAWRDAVIAAGGVPRSERPSIEEALARAPRLATAEVAASCGLPYAAAAAALWRGAAELRLAVTRTPGGELWSLSGP
jgi:Thioredoxin